MYINIRLQLYDGIIYTMILMIFIAIIMMTLLR